MKRHFIYLLFLGISLSCDAYTQVVTSSLNLHTVFVQSDSSLWAWGANTNGQLGDGTYENKSVPVKVGSDRDWKMAAPGFSHTIALKHNGTLWIWGEIDYTMLVDGMITLGKYPTKLGTDSDWVSIAAGRNQSIALKKDGTIWTWDNFNLLPAKVGIDTDWKLVYCGYANMFAIKNDGSYWAWGWNGYGQFGDGTTVSKTDPVRIGNDYNWKSLSPGGFHTLALKDDGSIWAWGYNNNGALGDGTKIDRYSPVQVGTDKNWKIITAVGNRSYALKTDGTLWTWGGINLTPVRVGNDNDWMKIYGSGGIILGIKSNGDVFTWGANEFAQLGNGTMGGTSLPRKINDGQKWIYINAGQNNSFGIKADGSLWGWGANFFGQLGDPSLVNHRYPYQLGVDKNWKIVSPGHNFTCAIKTDSSLWSWGLGFSGSLGDGTNQNRYTPKQIGATKDWKSIATGIEHTVALKHDSTLWAWGWNSQGQLGDGTYTNRNKPVQIGSAKDWKEVYAGFNSSFAIKYDGTLWQWGYAVIDNNGNQQNQRVPVRVWTDNNWDMNATSFVFHHLAIKQDGSLWGWGNNSNSEIYANDGTSWIFPRQIETSKDWKSVAAGRHHSVGIHQDGSLWAWGPLPLGPQPQISKDSFSLKPEQISVAKNWIAVDAGWGHVLALQKDSSLWTWGQDGYGQLGAGQSYFEDPQPISFKCETTYKGMRYPTIDAIEGRPINLTARQIGNSYLWRPLVGLTNSNSPNTVATITKELEYNVDIGFYTGCFVTDTVLVRFFKEKNILVPKAFTPNNDGQNDKLFPFLIGMKSLRYFRIYNRWGNLLYETSDTSRGWDGTYKGILQPMETYVWVAEGIDIDGIIIKRGGNTLLIR